MNGGREQSGWSQAWHSPWVSLCTGLIAGIAAFLQFRDAGLTGLFGILCCLTIIALAAAAVPVGRRWLEQRRWRAEAARLWFDHHQKMDTLAELADSFATVEKAKRLADALAGGVRVVMVLPVDGGIGVMLNIGSKEHVQVGTELLVHRIDRYTSDGQHIEEPLALVRVAYVQAENNCSQGIVIGRLDREYWDRVPALLRRDGRVEPPKNFAVPYIPLELRVLSVEELVVFQQSLETIRDSLARCGLGQVVEEENPQ